LKRYPFDAAGGKRYKRKARSRAGGAGCAQNKKIKIAMRLSWFITDLHCFFYSNLTKMERIMSAIYQHVGIPITTKKEGMMYWDNLKCWSNKSVDEYDYKIEYLKFEEGSPIPEIIHRNPHVAYLVDDMEKYLKDADQVIFEPTEIAPNFRIAFVIKDGAIIELDENTAPK
jgi:hypothetical protein